MEQKLEWVNTLEETAIHAYVENLQLICWSCSQSSGLEKTG